MYNLNEVIPEFVADVGTKKGEKVDFAILIDQRLSILIEVKPISMSLGNTQFNQLYRYFGVTEARLAILTNGREVWFFSDIDQPNKMDKKPFFVFDIQAHDEAQIEELSRFQKKHFSVESIVEAASTLKYVSAAENYLKQQLENPDDDFVRLIAKNIYDGSVTKPVLEQFRPAIQSSLDEIIRERIQNKLNITFRSDTVVDAAKAEQSPPPDDQGDGIETTEDEMQAFMIVRAIGAMHIPLERVTMRDAKSYCSIFIDNNNRKPVCRLYFNGKNTRSIGVFDSTKGETKFVINELSDIYSHAALIQKTVASYA